MYNDRGTSKEAADANDMVGDSASVPRMSSDALEIPQPFQKCTAALLGRHPTG